MAHVRAVSPPSFDRQTEYFLSSAPTWPELEPVPVEELLAARPRPRRDLQGVVLAAVAACLALLALAALAPS